MIKNIVIISSLFLSALTNAQGIEFFHGNWKEALEEASKKDKPIFVDAFTTWCGPCKAMAKNVFTKDEVGKFFNTNFINLKLDMESEEGKLFESKYPVSAYPTLFFIDAKGKTIKKVVGGQQAEGLINHGKEAIKNNDNSADLTKEYEAGKRDFDFMIKFIKSLNNAGKPSLKIANDYLAVEKNLTEEQIMKFTFESAIEADSKLFEHILLNKDKYITLVGKDKFNEKILQACNATLQKSIEFDTPDLMNEAIDKGSKGLTEGGEVFKYTSQMTYYQTYKNKAEYIKAADNLAKKSSGNDKTLRFIAEDLCKNYKDDFTVVKKATNMAEDAYNINGNIENLMFYCKMLIDSKKTDKAIKIAEQALTQAKKKEEKDNADQLEKFINFLKSKKA
jgi:thiol-disulfide isomerase/thioredoxin